MCNTRKNKLVTGKSAMVNTDDIEEHALNSPLVRLVDKVHVHQIHIRVRFNIICMLIYQLSL